MAECFGVPKNLSEVVKFKNQDYRRIRNRSTSQNIMWEDPKFLPDIGTLEWKRPGDIVANPCFILEGATVHDIRQELLNDCYMVAAMQALTTRPELLYWVVPREQGNSHENGGVAYFRIWQCGTWYEVVVDDRLPTKDGKVAYTRATYGNEFWCSLLEKAYAKVYGSYLGIEIGHAADAMVDFSGGISEKIILSDSPPNLENILLKAHEKECPMCLTINPGDINLFGPMNRLRDNHDYTINRVEFVSTPTLKILLVRLRNPWGFHEWKGPWSETSSEWNSVPEETKKKLGLFFRNDGEFWMSFPHVQEHFSILSICHICPDTVMNVDNRLGGSVEWSVNTFKGEWVKGVSAGGFSTRTIHRNPQYRVTLRTSDDGGKDGLCNIILSLLQKNKTRKIKYKLGIKVFKLTGQQEQSTPLGHEYFIQNPLHWTFGLIINRREIVVREKLPPGEYCIIPCTSARDEEGEFLLRVCTEKGSSMEEMDLKIGLKNTADIASDPPVIQVISLAPVKQNDEDVINIFHEVSEDNKVDWEGLQLILNSQIGNVSTSFFVTDVLIYTLDMVQTILEALIPFSTAFHGSESGTMLFSKEVCRSMVDMMDSDQSGKIDFEQVDKLWSNICFWNMIFERFRERKRYMESTNLRQALAYTGFSLNNRILNILVHRYADDEGHISLEDFIMCVVSLQSKMTCFESIKKNINKVEINLDDYISKLLV